MPASPLRKFKTEAARLKTLYMFSRYSFQTAARALAQEIRSGAVNPHLPIPILRSDTPGIDVAINAFEALHKIDSQYPRYLRETLFVRLVSALEVFLLDTVLQTFLARRDLFQTEQKLEFTYGDLLSVDSVTQLWSRVINRELRKLQNQGFKEIVRFFRNRFQLDLNDTGVSVATLEEFHDRRHILVHRLGRTDDEYRHRYNIARKLLTVTEDYFLDCLSTLLRFTEGVAQRADELAAQKPVGDGGRQIEFEVRIVIEVLSEEPLSILDPEFHYSAEDQIIRLSDILVTCNRSGRREELILAGRRAAVKAYLKLLKQTHARGQVVLVEKETLRSRRAGPHKCNLPRELIGRIADSLPQPPWPRHLHKAIAQQFGISNKEAHAAISVILHSGKLVQSVAASGRPPNIGMQPTVGCKSKDGDDD